MESCLLEGIQGQTGRTPMMMVLKSEFRFSTEKDEYG